MMMRMMIVAIMTLCKGDAAIAIKTPKQFLERFFLELSVTEPTHATQSGPSSAVTLKLC